MPSAHVRTALVTGASRGIGRAAALALGRAGNRVLVHYGRGAAEAQAVVEEIRDAGGLAEAVGADLSAADGPGALAASVRALVDNRLDVLVANAGISRALLIEETTIEDFDALFALNVRAPYFLVQQLLPVMVEGSSIIFTSSLAAHAAVTNLSAYAATKGAIDTLVKHLAFILGRAGDPRERRGPWRRGNRHDSNFTKTAEGRALTLGMQALKRIAQPEDIGRVIAFLASDAAEWVTGDTLRVDGGSKL